MPEAALVGGKPASFTRARNSELVSIASASSVA